MTYFTKRQPPQEMKYEENYFVSAKDPDGVVRDQTQEASRKIEDMWQEIQALKGYPPGMLLDVGCGMGHFLSAVPDRWERHGVDVSKFAIQHAIKNYGEKISFHHGTLRQQGFTSGLFDVVTCYHVIEHIEDPIRFMREISRVLRIGGGLLMATPDFDSICARRFGDKYRMLHDPTHISLFTRNSMDRLLEDAGFNIDQVEFPYWGTRWDTPENLQRMQAPEKYDVSPAFPGNLLSFYCTKIKHLGRGELL